MKLVRYGQSGQEKPGLIDAQGQLRDLSAHVADIDGAALSPASLHKLAAIDVASLPAVSGPVRHGSPVARVGKIICVGLGAHTGAGRCHPRALDRARICLKATLIKVHR